PLSTTEQGCGLSSGVSGMCPERQGCVRNDLSGICPDTTFAPLGKESATGQDRVSCSFRRQCCRCVRETWLPTDGAIFAGGCLLRHGDGRVEACLWRVGTWYWGRGRASAPAPRRSRCE